MNIRAVLIVGLGVCGLFLLRGAFKGNSEGAVPVLPSIEQIDSNSSPEAAASDAVGERGNEGAAEFGQLGVEREEIEAYEIWGWSRGALHGLPTQLGTSTSMDSFEALNLEPGTCVSFVRSEDNSWVVLPPIVDLGADLQVIESTHCVCFLDQGEGLLVPDTASIEWGSDQGARSNAPLLRRADSKPTPLVDLGRGVFLLPDMSQEGINATWWPRLDGYRCSPFKGTQCVRGVNLVHCDAAGSLQVESASRCVPINSDPDSTEIFELIIRDSRGAVVIHRGWADLEDGKPVYYDGMVLGEYKWSLFRTHGRTPAQRVTEQISGGALSLTSEEPNFELLLCNHTPLRVEDRFGALQLEVIGTPSSLPVAWRVPLDQYGDPGPLFANLSRAPESGISGNRISPRGRSFSLPLIFNGVDRYEAAKGSLPPGHYDVVFSSTGAAGSVHMRAGSKELLSFGPFDEASLTLYVEDVHGSPLDGFAMFAPLLETDEIPGVHLVGNQAPLANGRAELNLHGGLCRIFIHSPGFLGHSETVDLQAGRNEHLVVLKTNPEFKV